MENSLHPVLQRIFNKRNMTPEIVEEFLSWDLKKLPNFSQLNDVNKAALRIISAINANETIAVYGDYDVDGTTSCALLYQFFKMLGIEIKVIQPSRFVEGYGLHLSSIDHAKKENINVLITVDCGITNNEAAQYAQELGIDLIITDHHKDAREEMPKAFAVINPNRRDELDGPDHTELKSLAGVGVAFILAWEIRSELLKMGKRLPSIYPLLQYVAIGTICDLAYLNHTNLKLVRHGLKSIKEDPFPGIKIFFTEDELKAPFISSEKISFHVGPLINSKGRLEHPEAALKLLISTSLEEIRFLYETLVQCNQERKFIQAEVFKEAKELVLEDINLSQIRDEEHTISIVYRPHWHEGVIGIVASKLVETFKVPAIIFTDSEEKGIIKASCRSAGELDIFSLLDSQKELFKKFGGHKAAAGLSMPKDNLKVFAQNLKLSLISMPRILRTRMDTWDLDIKASEINPKLMRDLSLLGPFGMGNELPKFRMQNVEIKSFDILKDQHVKWHLVQNKTNLKGISFNFVGKFNMLSPKELFMQQKDALDFTQAFFTLSTNRFNGIESIQLLIEKIEI